MSNNIFDNTIPVGPLKLIVMDSCKELGEGVDKYIANLRRTRDHADKASIAFKGYEEDSYLVKAECPRFGSGESKGMIKSSIRGADLFIMTDVMNHSMTYSVCGETNYMSPDNHFQDLKRVIAASSAFAKRITVILPFLYESRQHKRTKLESLDSSLALNELVSYGVNNIITFDAHDPRIDNSIPLNGFDNFLPPFQFIKALLEKNNDIKIDNEHLMIISPDEGAMHRAVYFSNVLGVDMGMFYKRRDYSRIVDGRNPIVAHEFLGSSVEGKDVFIIDDMISSGESMLDVARELKKRKAKRIFLAATFGLFTNGMAKFDEAHESGLFDKILTTNLVYQSPELLSRDYYISVDMSKYIALLIDTLNHDASISDLLNPVERINKRVNAYKESHK